MARVCRYTHASLAASVAMMTRAKGIGSQFPVRDRFVLALAGRSWPRLFRYVTKTDSVPFTLDSAHIFAVRARLLRLLAEMI